MSEEIWKDIPGYEGLYQVSNLGRVKSTHFKSAKIMKQHVVRGGYLVVTLRKNKKQSGKYVHRLVAELFVEKRIGAWIVNHKDGDKTNNNSSNLEWGTFQQNILHAAYSLNKMSATPVACVETGIIYPSGGIAAKATGGDSTSILQACVDGHAYRNTHWAKIPKKVYYDIKLKYVKYLDKKELPQNGA